MPAVLDAPPDAAEDRGWDHNPFDSPRHLAASSYHARRGNKLANLSGGRDDPAHALRAATVDGAFRSFIGEASYPCVGAKSAVNNDSYRLAVYDGEIGGEDATAGLCRDLCRFSREFGEIDARFATLVAVFDGPLDLDERGFEDRLWRQLQALHDADAKRHSWDPAVSDDPSDPHFSFSFARRAFFVVGLHPAASRLSRRFPWPTIVFNAHEQFELLREEGKMERMKQVIRAKDERLQGEPNPVLRDFGDASEARQYSGRAVEADWTPPFKSKAARGKCPFHRLLRFGPGGPQRREGGKGPQRG